MLGRICDWESISSMLCVLCSIIVYAVHSAPLPLPGCCVLSMKLHHTASAATAAASQQHHIAAAAAASCVPYAPVVRRLARQQQAVSAHNATRPRKWREATSQRTSQPEQHLEYTVESSTKHNIQPHANTTTLHANALARVAFVL